MHCICKLWSRTRHRIQYGLKELKKILNSGQKENNNSEQIDKLLFLTEWQDKQPIRSQPISSRSIAYGFGWPLAAHGYSSSWRQKQKPGPSPSKPPRSLLKGDSTHSRHVIQNVTHRMTNSLMSCLHTHSLYVWDFEKYRYFMWSNSELIENVTQLDRIDFQQKEKESNSKLTGLFLQLIGIEGCQPILSRSIAASCFSLLKF